MRQKLLYNDKGVHLLEDIIIIALTSVAQLDGHYPIKFEPTNQKDVGSIHGQDMSQLPAQFQVDQGMCRR